MTKLGMTVLIGTPVLLLVIGYGIFTYVGTSNEGGTQATSTPNTITDGTNVRMVTVATSTEHAAASGSYPQVSNASDVFNARIVSTVNKAIEEHFQGAKENWDARNATAQEGLDLPLGEGDIEKFPISFRTDIARNDGKVFSAVMFIDQYSGGAHGIQAIVTFNYNIANQKEITTETLIANDPQFLNKISVYARATLLRKLAESAQVEESEIDKEMLHDGTTPNISNFSLFTYTSESQLTFYFTPYQVAAYVFGSPEIAVELPLK